ncbi:MAG: helicase-related protein, partial [Actinomycetes bacterium]
HRMSAHFYGNEVKPTKRYLLGRSLGHITRHFLLMTATPHAGKDEDFQLFMALLDPDRFVGKPRGAGKADTADLMRRMIKERLLRFDGRPLFPERRAYSVPYALTAEEARLYEQVTDYVREEMGRADRLRDRGEGRRGNRVGFALTVLQRRLASSPEAIYQSLVRRVQRLSVERDELRSGGMSRIEQALAEVVYPDDESEFFEDMEAAELEEVEEQLVDSASAARTAAELDLEIATLERLAQLARRVRDAGTDRKWTQFASLLDDAPQLRRPDGGRRKLIVFTEHRDTLNYLVERLRTRLGRPDAVVTIHGGTKREDRRAIQETFTQDRDCLVMVATDAAGEGINLQQAHLLVNYDLPWNPNRIEQRFGRVHRIGQTEVCHMWNLVAAETREGEVYLRLLDKLDEQRAALGGQVFDVLGEALPGRNLRDLLLEAVCYGDRPEVRARLDEVIDARVGDGLAELVRAHALASDVMSIADVQSVRLRMEEAAARRLQPHHVSAFFLAALEHVGGRAVPREAERFEVTHVPAAVRTLDRQRGGGRAPLLARYERICFDKDKMHLPGRPVAELVVPGHPLLDALIELLLERHGDVLRQGAVLVDESDPSERAHVLVGVDSAIADGRSDSTGRPTVVSRHAGFVALGADGEPSDAGPAPYLDLRPATDDELAALR